MIRIESRGLAIFTLAFVIAIAVTGSSLAQTQARNLRKVCEADTQKFCAAVESGGGRLLQCLQDHSSELAPDCKSALDSLTARIKDRRG